MLEAHNLSLRLFAHPYGRLRYRGVALLAYPTIPVAVPHELVERVIPWLRGSARRTPRPVPQHR